MTVFINLAPYLHRLDESADLLSRWQGGIEIMMDGPNWKTPVDWDIECKRFISFTGPISVHGPIWELNIASARYEGIRQYSLEVYKQCLEWCSRIGAEHMVLHPNLYSTPLFLRAESQQYAKENLKRLGEHAQKHNVALAVENIGFHEYALFNQEEYTRLFDEIDSITALVDIGHANVNNWDIPMLIRDLGSVIKAVHVHDNDGIEDLHQAIGMGSIDWEPIWKELKQLNHSYRVILEYSEDASTELLLEHGIWLQNKLYT